MNYTELDGVRIYGQPTNGITADEFDKLNLDDSMIIHLLRHFKSISTEYRDKLTGRGISEETIDSALATIGSKFELNLIQEGIADPELLFSRAMATDKKLVWIERQGKRYTSFSFFTDQPIGYEGLVSLDSLDNHQKSLLTQKPRGKIAGDDFMVWTLNLPLRPQTNKITVELYLDLKQPVLKHISIYPGNLAPDFPSADQSDEERAYNLQYWQNTAFLF